MFKEHIHYSKDLECAVLGACLLEKTAFARIRGILKPECFHYEGNQQVYLALEEMWDNNVFVDILTVVHWIVHKGVDVLDGFNAPYFVTKLTNSVVSTAHLEYHALLVRQMFCERELMKIQNEKNDMTIDTLDRIHELKNRLEEISSVRSANDWSEMADTLISLSKHMEEVKGKNLIGVPTGFESLDLITGGFAKTNLIVLAARPSVGKSAILNSIAIHAASEGHNVGIVSLEMPKIQIAARMASLVSDIDFYKIFRNRMDDEEQSNKLISYFQSLSDLPICVSDRTNVNISDIRAKSTQLIHKHKLDILFIDYLQLVETEGRDKNFNREQEVAKLSRGLKLMAMDFEIPIVVLAQLNRESEKLANKKPQLHHLRESGAIEQDADGVIFLHRDWKVGIQADENGNSTERQADLIVAKWRNGETSEIKIGFDPPKMKFYDLGKEIRPPGWKPYKD